MQQHRSLDLPDGLEDVCDAERIALLVYDMQVGVVGQLPDGPQVTERVARVLDAARRAGVRVFFIRYMTLPTELMGVFQLRTAMAWQRRDRVEDVVSLFLRDSPGFELMPELAPTASEAIFDRLSMSAFEGTPLEFALRDAQVTAFAIVGVAMEVGIEPTVRHGADLGLIPVVVTDACGAGNQAAAKRSLEALKTAGDAILTDISMFTGLLARPTTGRPGPRGPQPAGSPRNERSNRHPQA
jgi:biuret amidohydrolase